VELIIKGDSNVRVEQWVPGAGSWQAIAEPRTLLTKVHELSFVLLGFIPHIALRTVRGLMLRPGTRVVIKQASRYWPAFARGEGVFKFRSANRMRLATAKIGWGSDNGDGPFFPTDLSAGAKLADFMVPAAKGNVSDLVIQVPEKGGAPLFFGVHRLLKRRQLYSRCKGIGVEIGPGPKPQILPSAHTAVNYVEQATPEAWEKLYGKHRKLRIDSGLWRHYVVGNADAIPVAPQSLDFVFSSHVIEHLANPLGHLAYWATLLKASGVIAAVIPDHRCCKDYVFPASTMDELDAEYQLGSMSPSLSHYRRWARHRAQNTDPEEILNSGRSIHVHFYTPESMERILEKVHRQLGFQRFAVTREHNHKDFFVLLEK